MTKVYNKNDLINDLHNLKINSQGTLLVHSSMKSIGSVNGKANTVLDSLSEYMKEGLLVLPTHTWNIINKDNPDFFVKETPCCVGILPEVFRKREKVYRSFHPTHSVAALGKDAEEYIKGDEDCQTPVSPNSTWGKLYKRKAQIALIGVDLTKCTYIHCIEEIAGIPNRIKDNYEYLTINTYDKQVLNIPSRRHIGNPSENYHRVEKILLESSAMSIGRFGDAEVRVCDVVKMTSIILDLLKENPMLFNDLY